MVYALCTGALLFSLPLPFSIVRAPTERACPVSRLIMSGLPFPIEEIPDEDRAVPIVLSVPHSGIHTPEDVRGLYAQDPDRLAQLGDLYVDELFKHARDAGITVVRTPYSRFLVDLNRFADDLSPESVHGARVQAQPGYHGKRGVIWAVSPNGYRLYKRPLTRIEAKERLLAYYHPYHEAVFTHLYTLRERFGYAILIDGHSMPSRSLSLRGRPRADIVPGDLNGESCAPELSRFVCRWWEDAGYMVHPNHPYRGGAITRQHGRPHQHIHAIQLEFNRSLYMREDTLDRSHGFERLQSDCRRFLQGLCALDLRCSMAAE